MNVNQQDKNGNTVLMIAAESGNADTVKLLLDAGADVNLAVKRYNSEYTALRYAEGNEEIAAMLRRAGAR